MGAKGATPLTFHELTAAGSQRFHDAIAAAKQSTPFGASVHAYAAGDYAHLRTFLTPDGKAGFALKDGDIVSAFKHTGKAADRYTDSALALATQEGGNRLDAFDTVLPGLYSDSGFRAVARLPFSDEFKPDGWNYQTFAKFNGGRPDVVFMVHDPAHAAAYKPGDGVKVATYEEGVAAQARALDALKKQASFRALKVQSLQLLLRREFNPDEPRDESGKWTDGGGGGAADQPSAVAEDKPTPNPEAIKVGGDEWNKQTAARLEHEYVAAHDALDKIAEEAVGGRAKVPEPSENPDDEDEDQPYVPEEWDAMSSDQQSDAFDKYKDQTYQSYLDSEIENWASETKPDDARAELAWKFTKGDDTDWAKEALNEYLDQRDDDGEQPLPYSADALLDALTISHDTGNYPISKGTDIGIDDAKLEPDLAANQPALPGMEGVGVTSLKAADKAAIIETISEAFGKRAEAIEDDIEPPEYLSDSVKEYQEQSWDSMDADDKFNWVKNNTDIIDDAEKAAEGAPLDKLPTKFDPLQENASAADYKRTQVLARTMSVDRAAQLLVERGLFKADKIDEARNEIARIDSKLWAGWKSNSMNDRGQLLQVATAEELGGRLYEHKDMDRDQVIANANDNYKAIGGFKGIEAYVRAKWETSQYLLDQAGVHTLMLYRAINIQEPPTFMVSQSGADETGGAWKVVGDYGATQYFDSKEKAEAYKAEQEALNPPERVEPVKTAIGPNEATYQKLPDLSVRRNGAASTSTHSTVSNSWDGRTGRVVLRAEVPRTAVISVPAYGINVQSEHEVVVAGTAWKAWDAWKETAPEFEAVPMHKGGIAA